jgi:tRNA pseudouridine55 synthase
MVDGIVLLDKPKGITSHDLVDKVRGILNQKRVGHTGILDPLATGLMIMLLGKGTLFSPQLTGADKRYRADIIFGKATDTFDAEGKTVSEKDPGSMTIDEFKDLYGRFQGKVKQLVPPYSAAKLNGQKMYESARRGEDMPDRFKDIEFHSIELVAFNWPEVTLDIHCSAGTYVRSLAHEMGLQLGCGAYLNSLIRTGVGNFALDQAITVDEFQKFADSSDFSKIRSLSEAMPSRPRITIRPECYNAILEGKPFIKKYVFSTNYKGPGGCLSLLVDGQSKVLALAQLNYSWGNYERLDSRDLIGKYVRIIDEGHIRQERA